MDFGNIIGASDSTIGRIEKTVTVRKI